MVRWKEAGGSNELLEVMPVIPWGHRIEAGQRSPPPIARGHSTRAMVRQAVDPDYQADVAIRGCKYQQLPCYSCALVSYLINRPIQMSS